ncbi:MAG: M81 family peptidase [Alphaproteobacteria bacterium]|nr:MAG: M81 family peptidase [Alphaproteobacteria bacterium]
MTRIAIAGFQHETNTFGATRAGFAEFEIADSWPPLLQGEAVISGTEGSNLPLAGFVRAARRRQGVALAPQIWCSAEPSAEVRDDAFERIAGMILDRLRAAGPVDGLYLDLHGAMVTESHEDGEGELMRRIRAAVGPDLPIAVSLDLHANLTRAMVEHASAITIFRTYPHLDMAETGERAFAALMGLIGGGRVFAAWRQLPFLIPLQAQHTGAEPCAGLYAHAAAFGPAPDRWAEIALGFPAADIHDAGPAVLAYAPRAEEAAAAADALAARMIAAEHRFDVSLVPAAEAVARAIALAESASGPVVIADVQDNPGAGAPSDSTGLLRELVAQGAERAVLGMLNDPELAAQAHALGQGARFAADLGGKAGPDPRPYRGRFEVERLSDGSFAFTGAMYAGSVAETGPSALLRVLDGSGSVRVVVGSRRCQALDRAIFTYLGVDPAREAIVAVKSTVHFRADFEPIAAAVINAEAPGLNPCRLETVPYRRLRPGLRRRIGLPEA